MPVTPAKPDAGVAGFCVTTVGHASPLIQVAGINILTDPVWSERASPFTFAGPRRVTPPGIRFDDLPPVDVILLSHCHYDHMDVETLQRLHAAHAPLMAMPLGKDANVRAAVPGARCVTGDWWDEPEPLRSVAVARRARTPPDDADYRLLATWKLTASSSNRPR